MTAQTVRDPDTARSDPEHDRDNARTGRSRHGTERPAAQDRGTTRVHPNAVRKIAEHTADMTDGTITAPRRAGGRRTGADARVRDRGDVLDIALEVALRYPASVTELAAHLRSRVIDEVHRLTGCRVRRVAITVSALRSDVGPRVE